MAAGIVGDFFGGVRLQVEDVELLRPATGIALPSAEIAEQRRVDNLLAIGRDVAGAGLRHGESLGKAAIDGDGIEAAVAQIEIFAERAEDHGFAIGSPAIDLIVVSPAGGKRAAGRIERQLLGNATGGGDYINLLVAVVLSGEGNPFPIGREFGEKFEAGMRGKPGGHSARGRCGPEIACVREDDFVAMNIGKAQELGLRGGWRDEN